MDVLAAVEAFESPLDAYFRRRPLRSWDDVDAGLFGDVWWCLDGRKINRGEPVGQRRRLPALLDTHRTVLGDLIPQTSWGSSLANLLTGASWNALRRPLIAANHNVCELCGRQHDTLDAHEVWSYEFPGAEDWAQRHDPKLTVCGTQHLVGLMAICKTCHECFHTGLANARGRLDEVLERIAGLNNWSMEEAIEYYKATGTRWERASEIHWILDLSRVEHPDGGVIVKSPWEVSTEDPRFVTAPSRVEGEPDMFTALLGVRWRFANEEQWRPALSAADLEGNEGNDE